MAGARLSQPFADWWRTINGFASFDLTNGPNIAMALIGLIDPADPVTGIWCSIASRAGDTALQLTGELQDCNGAAAEPGGTVLKTKSANPGATTGVYDLVFATSWAPSGATEQNPVFATAVLKYPDGLGADKLTLNASLDVGCGATHPVFATKAGAAAWSSAGRMPIMGFILASGKRLCGYGAPPISTVSLTTGYTVSSTPDEVGMTWTGKAGRPIVRMRAIVQPVGAADLEFRLLKNGAEIKKVQIPAIRMRANGTGSVAAQLLGCIEEEGAAYDCTVRTVTANTLRVGQVTFPDAAARQAVLGDAQWVQYTDGGSRTVDPLKAPMIGIDYDDYASIGGDGRGLARGLA